MKGLKQMILEAEKSKVTGEFHIPGSKSHTIRAVIIASLANGESLIKKPLISEDAMSAVNVCRGFGAKIEIEDNLFRVNGFGKTPSVPDNILDVGNSATTLRLSMMVAGLIDGMSIFTGDESIRSRPVGDLIYAMNNLGANVYTTKNNNKAPVIIKGPVRGGKTKLNAVTSQYLSSLLISLPLIENDSEIEIIKLNEVPYVDMTLSWLDKQNIKYENDNYKRFIVYGNQEYKTFEDYVTGDFSSATFPLVEGAVSGNRMELNNLDMNDSQGDKKVIEILKKMGVNIIVENNKIIVNGGELNGIDIDMNDIPDALPAMSVLGCFAKGTTKLLNVPQARLKETDRISAMYKELKKLGANVEELEDGLIIHKSNLIANKVKGYHDHRIVMALAVAGLNIEGKTVIDTAEAINVTYPSFVKDFKDKGASLNLIQR
jgi:3-phosphoshikimate 1-carboxyvinyltransferase